MFNIFKLYDELENENEEESYNDIKTPDINIESKNI